MQAIRRDGGPMTASRLAGIGGLAVAVGAVAYIVHVVARSMLTAGVDPATSAQAALWVPVNALGAVGAAMVLLGLPAISPLLVRRDHPAGLTGFALLAVSWTFFGPFLSLYGALVLPWLAVESPELIDGSAPTPAGFVVAYALGLLAWLAGTALLAKPFLKGQSQPRWIGYALPASTLWLVIGSFVIAPDGPASNLAVNLLSNLGPVLLLIALGYMGVRTWAGRAPDAHVADAGTDGYPAGWSRASDVRSKHPEPGGPR